MLYHSRWKPILSRVKPHMHPRVKVLLWIFSKIASVNHSRLSLDYRSMPGGDFLFKGITFVFLTDLGYVCRGWGIFVQRNYLCFLTDLGYVCWGDFLFKGIAFVFWQIWGTYAGRGDFLFKEITFVFWQIWGTYARGGFFVQRNCLWFLRFFCTNSRQFFQRDFFVFQKFWFWDT